MSSHSNKSYRKLVSYMMYITAFAMPLTVMPQIIQIYTTKVVTGISLSSWVMYLLFGIVPLIYGISEKIKPLIITNILWIVVDIAIIVGIIKYGNSIVPEEYGKLLIINNIGKFLTMIALICLSISAALFAEDLAVKADR